MWSVSTFERKLWFEYGIIECYKHSNEKAIVYLNYKDDKNIGIKTEREIFEDIADDSLSIRSKESGIITVMFWGGKLILAIV